MYACIIAYYACTCNCVLCNIPKQVVSSWVKTWACCCITTCQIFLTLECQEPLWVCSWYYLSNYFKHKYIVRLQWNGLSMMIAIVGQCNIGRDFVMGHKSNALEDCLDTRDALVTNHFRRENWYCNILNSPKSKKTEKLVRVHFSQKCKWFTTKQCHVKLLSGFECFMVVCLNIPSFVGWVQELLYHKNGGSWSL